MRAPDLDFLSALGEEFCVALSPPVPDHLLVPHDGYEVWRRAFGADPSPPEPNGLVESHSVTWYSVAGPE